MHRVLRQLCKFYNDTEAFYILYSFANAIFSYSLEAAAQSPDSLSQDAIIENLNPVEAERLSRVRNIVIAVCRMSCRHQGMNGYLIDLL